MPSRHSYVSRIQELTEKIMERMNVYIKEPEEKCMTEILKHVFL